MNFFHFLRVKAGLSQRALAQKTGANHTIISRLEQGWFARCPEGLESKFQEIFGKDWTFKRLMQSVPDIAADESDVA